MRLTQLNRECLLHLFSFLDKDSRRNLSLACRQLREVYLDPCLWNLLHFSSPCQLRWDNYVLGPSLRYLTICWYSSRVQLVCNIEDWLKTSFQKDICSKHESLVSTFLAHVCHM
ncbi:F-box and leucine-rich protein 22 [Characodon lateralis]|nr:F-box and leucine-rich protein 22 [Characodon lateralis]